MIHADNQRAYLMQMESTSYGDFGPKAFLRGLVAVSS